MKKTKAIILAAGFESKLSPLPQDKPKALWEINGKTLLDHLMIQLEVIDTIEEVIIITNGQFYLDFFRWRKQAQYRRSISIEENSTFYPEKKCGAVKDLLLGIASAQGKTGDYLVLCTDNYFDYPLSHFLLACLAHPGASFIGLYDVKSGVFCSQDAVAEIDHDGKVLSEKSGSPDSAYIYVGVYYFPLKFKFRVFDYLTIQGLNSERISDFFAWLSKKESVYGVEFEGSCFDIEHPECLTHIQELREKNSGTGGKN